ncbi:MAG: hypothetical protein ABI693_23955 [Bryobacteraceae bacterium]
MKGLLALFWCAAVVLAAPPTLPLRWSIGDPSPVIRKTVQPLKFAESVGQRAAILGREDGQFEAWVYPLKVLSAFRLSVYFDGSLEPVPLADMAEQIVVGPGRVTITHSHAAFTVKQTWVASIEGPVLAVLLDIETARPLRLRVSLTPEMKPMWPASFGGQSSEWDSEANALVMGEATRQWFAIVGSPAVSRVSEMVGHQLPDRTVMLEMDVTPEEARTHLYPLVITAGKGREAVQRQYTRALAALPQLVASSDAYYERFAKRTMQITTPDPVINHAYEWAKLGLEKGWACNEGVGCGLVAGWAPSGLSERPGFGWYFGGDALMNSWAILDYGDLPRVRALLEFLGDHQRADGKMMHEWTQSGALLDWTKFPYGYYHADTTPLYLFSAARYVSRSGDLDYLARAWPSLQRAYQFCLTALDDDGLMSNKKAGAAAVETGALSGRVAKDVYLAGAWLAGLDGYLQLAGWQRDAAAARDATDRLAIARASLNQWFDPAKGHLPFGRLTDGSLYNALSGWQSLALAYGGLDPAKAARAAETLNRPEVSTDWGIRLFATDSPSYDPLSYNDGSVWPFVTGFSISAQYANRKPSGAFQQLYGLAAMTGLSGAGFLTEYLSGERAQSLPRAVPHQLFSDSAVVTPLVSGLLGLKGDALLGTLDFAPQLPPHWDRVEFSNYRVGESSVSGWVRRQPGRMELKVDVSGKPLKVRLAPMLHGSPEVASREVLSNSFVESIVFSYEEGVEFIAEPLSSLPGDRSLAPRLLKSDATAGAVRFVVAVPAGWAAGLRFRCGRQWRAQTGYRDGLYWYVGTSAGSVVGSDNSGTVVEFSKIMAFDKRN